MNTTLLIPDASLGPQPDQCSGFGFQDLGFADTWHLIYETQQCYTPLEWQSLYIHPEHRGIRKYQTASAKFQINLKSQYPMIQIV
jgi:hypothetical protein